MYYKHWYNSRSTVDNLVDTATSVLSMAELLLAPSGEFSLSVYAI